MENKTLMTDYYEYTMAQTYFDCGMKDTIVYFDVFFRKNPFNGGYTVSGGLDEIIKFIQNINYSEDKIEYLRNKKCYSEEFLEHLKNLKFEGDLYAIPDGTPVFPNEPVLTIKCDIITAQVLETALLTNFNHGSLVTTAAKRITTEAGNIPVMEFGARRARGENSAIEASKHAYIGGCVGTSNTEAGMRYGIPVMGTMAHSLVTAFDSEYDAFLAYAKSNPSNTVFLVDTYDTLKSGIPNAIKVAQDYLIPNGYKFNGIRIDSGDLAYLSKEARKMLDEAGFTHTKICLSNGLNEYTIGELLKQGAVIDSIGAGDNVAAPKERVGGVYKLVALEKNNKIIPKIKVSNDSIKTINPGYKKVYRFYDNKTGYALGDVIALADEIIPKDKYTLIDPVDNWKTITITDYTLKELQVPIFKNGELIYDNPTLKEKQDYCKKEIESLYPEVKRIAKPHGYYVDLSLKLLNLKKELIEAHRKESNKIKVKSL